MNEKLLEAWLRLTTILCNDRIVSEMPYNEALICNILYRHQMRDKVNKLTATDLCRQTKMLKSQMNRTLQKMEEKNIITRQRSSTDRRQIFISLNPNADSFYIQHHKSLRLIDALATKAGPEKSQEAIDLFTYIANMAEEMIEDNTES
ncbi:MarR family transcriptional regulator [Lachnospiraceae bacterium]|nr:MarR family transcriptional regulator [Lachnospiraceae bacterium]